MEIETRRGWILFWLGSGAFWFAIIFLILGGGLVYELVATYYPSLPYLIHDLFGILIAPSIPYLTIVISAYGAILAVFLGFLYPGRLVFMKPPHIIFTSISTTKIVSKTDRIVSEDAIVLPLSCINTGATGRSLTFAMVICQAGGKANSKKVNGRKLSTGESKEEYFVLTNDYSLSQMPYSEWRRELSKKEDNRLDAVADYDLMGPFTVGPRSSSSEVCVFVPPIGKPNVVSKLRNKEVAIYLFYRDKTIGKGQYKRIKHKYESACSGRSTYEPAILSSWLVNGGWKMGFRIDKMVPPEIGANPSERRRTVDDTRFGFYRYNSRWGVPYFLLCEDLV